jgi:hypothetical protein
MNLSSVIRVSAIAGFLVLGVAGCAAETGGEPSPSKNDSASTSLPTASFQWHINPCDTLPMCQITGSGQCDSHYGCASGYSVPVSNLTTGSQGGRLTAQPSGGDLIATQGSPPTDAEVALCTQYTLWAQFFALDGSGNEYLISNQVSNGNWTVNFTAGLSNPLYVCQVKDIAVNGVGPGNYRITAGGYKGSTQLPVTLQAGPW